MLRQRYPVSYEIERPAHYNRWTVFFRLILVIPQAILVGGSYYALFYYSDAGILEVVLGVLVFFAWFAILFSRRFPSAMRDFCVVIFRWAQNVRAYVLLQAANYPPFGDKPYALNLVIIPAARYRRWTVFFRAILVIPHYIVLFFLGIAQIVVTVIAWFAILFSGQYPAGMFNFSVDVSRWSARVGAYLDLFVDEYPPFSLDAEPGAQGIRPESI